MVVFKVTHRLIVEKIWPSYVGKVWVVPRLCVLYPGNCLTTDGKKYGKKNLSQVSLTVPGRELSTEPNLLLHTFLGREIYIATFTKIWSCGESLSVHTMTFFCKRFHFNLILPSTPKFLKWSELRSMVPKFPA